MQRIDRGVVLRCVGSESLTDNVAGMVRWRVFKSVTRQRASQGHANACVVRHSGAASHGREHRSASDGRADARDRAGSETGFGGEVWSRLAPMAKPEQTQEAAARRWRVLLAEDDSLLANTVDDFLSDEGFCVSLAADGLQALKHALDQPFDVLLTDLRMPHIDGSELIRQLRAKRPDLPVVVMSGNAPVDLRSRLMREGNGPMVMVTKPMRLQELLQALQMVLRNAAH